MSANFARTIFEAKERELERQRAALVRDMRNAAALLLREATDIEAGLTPPSTGVLQATGIQIDRDCALVVAAGDAIRTMKEILTSATSAD